MEFPKTLLSTVVCPEERHLTEASDRKSYFRLLQHAREQLPDVGSAALCYVLRDNWDGLRNHVWLQAQFRERTGQTIKAFRGDRSSDGRRGFQKAVHSRHCFGHLGEIIWAQARLGEAKD